MKILIILILSISTLFAFDYQTLNSLGMSSEDVRICLEKIDNGEWHVLRGELTGNGKSLEVLMGELTGNGIVLDLDMMEGLIIKNQIVWKEEINGIQLKKSFSNKITDIKRVEINNNSFPVTAIKGAVMRNFR